MENAGRSAAQEILRLRREQEAKGLGRVVVLVGPGNNGGDACVAIRHLSNAGVAVDAFSSEAPRDRAGTPRDAAVLMRRVVERMGIGVNAACDEPGLLLLSSSLASASVIVDGLLGTGFRGEARPEMARVIEAVNAAARTTGASVVALDLPSGLDADTGRPSLSTVVAHLTVTFAARKLGFDAPEAQPYIGRIVVATIGAPAELIQRVRGTRADPGRGE